MKARSYLFSEEFPDVLRLIPEPLESQLQFDTPGNEVPNLGFM
jgi:hypothetical protein